MLRIELTDATTLCILGRLTAECSEEVKVLMEGQTSLGPLEVDLSEVTYIDHDGEELLRWLGKKGALFKSNMLYPRHVCERLHLVVSNSCS